MSYDDSMRRYKSVLEKMRVKCSEMEEKSEEDGREDRGARIREVERRR